MIHRWNYSWQQKRRRTRGKNNLVHDHSPYMTIIGSLAMFIPSIWVGEGKISMVSLELEPMLCASPRPLHCAFLLAHSWELHSDWYMHLHRRVGLCWPLKSALTLGPFGHWVMHSLTCGTKCWVIPLFVSALPFCAFSIRFKIGVSKGRCWAHYFSFLVE